MLYIFCVYSKAYAILDELFYIWHKWWPAWEGVLCAMTLYLIDDYIQNVGILDKCI